MPEWHYSDLKYRRVSADIFLCLGAPPSVFDYCILKYTAPAVALGREYVVEIDTIGEGNGYSLQSWWQGLPAWLHILNNLPLAFRRCCVVPLIYYFIFFRKATDIFLLGQNLTAETLTSPASSVTSKLCKHCRHNCHGLLFWRYFRLMMLLKNRNVCRYRKSSYICKVKWCRKAIGNYG